MRYENIADIYSANQKYHERLIAVLSGVSAEEANRLPDGHKWTIQQIVEHIAIVADGTLRVCRKLLESARTNGKASDGTMAVSADFNKKSAVIAGMKVQAPDRVQPTGHVTIPEAIRRINVARESFDALRGDLERFDLSGEKFPHPFFGDISATEWLMMAGGHEQRHTQQIEKLLENIRE